MPGNDSLSRSGTEHRNPSINDLIELKGMHIRKNDKFLGKHMMFQFYGMELV